jgi:hypothetical protein
MAILQEKKEAGEGTFLGWSGLFWGRRPLFLCPKKAKKVL